MQTSIILLSIIFVILIFFACKSKNKSFIKKAIITLSVIGYVIIIVVGLITDLYKSSQEIAIFLYALIMSLIVCTIDVGLSGLIIDARNLKNEKYKLEVFFLCLCRLFGVFVYTFIMNIGIKHVENTFCITLAVFIPAIIINLWRDVFTFQCLEDKINELGEKYCKEDSSPTKEN